MEENLSGSLHIHNLPGVIRTVMNGKEGVFIPFNENHVALKGDKMFYNWFAFPFRDEYGNDYMVVRSKTKQETLNKIQTEIVGNIRIWRARGDGENTYSAPPKVPKKNDYTPTKVQDDDPF
jgi:hypothetical protein